MLAQVRSTHKHMQIHTHTHTNGNRKRISEAKSPDVQDDRGEMRKRGLGGGVECLEGGDEKGWGGLLAVVGGGVYCCLKGSGCCVQINKWEIIAEGLYIYFLS